MIRVDHAGERGADTIYNGQWDVLKDTESGDLIKVRIRRSRRRVLLSGVRIPGGYLVRIPPETQH